MRKINIIILGFILICSSFLVFPFSSLNNFTDENGINNNSYSPENSNVSNLNESSVKTISDTHGLSVPSTEFIPVKNNIIKNTSMQVNPSLFYSSEPAPMGLADYGIYHQTGQIYSYSTTEFLGSAEIYSLNTTGGIFSGCVSLQLNVILKFTAGSSLYVYWLQDVVQINTTSNEFSFIDNVWNSSLYGGADISSAGMIGNGVIASAGSSTFYYCEDSHSYVQSYPNTIQMKITSSLDNNREPTASFEYDAGNGVWITYDEVTFTPINGPINDMNLVVDGSQYAPSGNYYDAELVLCGDGGGATTTLQGNSKIDLQLEYYNGNNFQFIPYLYTYGSNTAETISNVIDKSYYHGSDGYYFNELTPGSGNFVISYDMQSAFVIFSLPYNTGGTFSISSNPGLSVTFTGNKAQVTIYPGTYTVHVGNWENTYNFYSGMNSVIALPSLPGVPTTFKAVNSKGSVQLSWQQSSNCGSPILHYTIYRGTNPDDETFLCITTSTYYTDNDVSPATIYYYTITATNGVGTSLYSSETSVSIPGPGVVSGAPTHIHISSSSNVNTIIWNSPDNSSGYPILLYNIYKGTSPGNETYLCSVNSSQTNYYDYGVESGITYYYKVTAINSVGESQASTEISAIIPKSPNIWLIFGIIELAGIGSLTYLLVFNSKKNKRTIGDSVMPQSSLTPE